jgi:hypothetical protein
MSDSEASAGDRSAAPEASPKRRFGERRGLLGKLARLVEGANKTVVALGTFLGAVAAIVAAIALLLPSTPPAPPVTGAKFEEAQAESGVLLEQYDDTLGAKANADDGSPPPLGGYRLVADTEPASPASSGVFVAVAEVSNLAGTSSPGAPTNAQQQAAQQQAAQQEEEKVKKELQQQEAAELKEEEKQREQAKLDEAKALQEQEKQKQEAAGDEEAQLKAEQREKAEQHKAEARAAKALAEAHVSATETAAVKKEEEHPVVVSPASSTPLHREGQAKVATGTGAPTREVEAVLRKAGVETSSGCGACGFRPTVERAITDTSSNLEQAAKLVAAAFRSSRVGVFEHKRQPLGATVTYVINFVGYAGKRVALEWTLFSERTGRPLPREWWRNVIVKQIKPTSNTTRVAGSFWAPLPPAPGNYYFRLRVFYGETEIAHERTDLFH